MIPKWEDVGRPERGRVTDRWASSRGPNPKREGTAREGLMEGDVTGVHVLDRLLVSRESGKAPISNTDDLLEIGSIGKNEKRGTGSPDTDPDLAGGEEGNQVRVGPGTRVGCLANTHSGERGATPESIFESKVPDMVVVRKDPSGRETGE